MLNFRRAGAAALILATASTSLAACGDDEETAGAKTVTVSLSDAGCTPQSMELDNGPTTFNVTNSGSSKVTEFEVLSGDTIIGEVENITKGIERSFTLNLKPGEYTALCLNGTAGSGKITVKNTTMTSLPGGSTEATEKYRAYVQQEANDLVERTQAFTAAVTAGDIAKAKSLYAPARVPYERIEPVAESFGDLDPAIDGRADDTPVEQITGFHRLEYALWVSGNTDGMTDIVNKLMADVRDLRNKVSTFEFDASQIANGANELLGEVTQSKVTGEEERYSHTDIVDFAANVEGAKAAVDAVRHCSTRAMLDWVPPLMSASPLSKYCSPSTRPLTPTSTTQR